MRQGRTERHFASMDKLSKLEPPLSEQEIRVEVEAARAERRRRAPEPRSQP
jgi:hypothetical protein